MMLDKKFWKNKKVLITGHTGFKGGWISLLLHILGSKVSGYSLNPVGKNNFFNAVGIKSIFQHDFRSNITNLKKLKKALKIIKPDIIFHMAAQSSVIESFKDSNNTILSNIIGTSNLLEVIKDIKNLKCIIFITTDKVYKLTKRKKYFSENSELGGNDIYSSSKACSEILINSYKKSFFLKKKYQIASVRAGNCFGGGDWKEDRIVTDCLKSFFYNKTLVLRNPKATRPWQHVIEPLVGYLILAEKLSSKKGSKYSGAWNFGPSFRQNMKVIKLAEIFKKQLNSSSKILIKKKNKKFYNKKFEILESQYLELDSKKAFRKLKWKPVLSIKEAVNLTVKWYKDFKDKKNLNFTTSKQIQNYLSKYSS